MESATEYNLPEYSSGEELSHQSVFCILETSHGHRPIYPTHL